MTVKRQTRWTYFIAQVPVLYSCSINSRGPSQELRYESAYRPSQVSILMGPIMLIKAIQKAIVTHNNWQLFNIYWRHPLRQMIAPSPPPSPTGCSQKNWVASQNLYPLCNQNLLYSLPYIRPDHKFDSLLMTRLLNQNPVSDQR